MFPAGCSVDSGLAFDLGFMFRMKAKHADFGFCFWALLRLYRSYHCLVCRGLFSTVKAGWVLLQSVLLISTSV